jgi:hypothetical protein
MVDRARSGRTFANQPDPVEDETFSTRRDPSAELRMGVWLTAICVLLIAGGLAIPMVTGAGKTPSPITLGDVSEAHLVEIRDASGSTVLSGEFRSRVDSLGNTEKDAALTDSRGQTVIGEVELEIPSRARNDRRPELEVDVIGLPPRETFRVVIDDRTVGVFTTDDRGSIDEELQEGEMPATAGNSGAPARS